MDEFQTLRDLLEIMRANDLDVLKVKIGDKILELVRREDGEGSTPAQAAAASQTAEAAPETPAPNVKKVTAPLAGVFYRSSAPDAEPFVTEGDRVDVGQALCILEAMKLFNEITSDYAGTVTRIIPENGELVSLGQELIWIEQ